MLLDFARRLASDWIDKSRKGDSSTYGNAADQCEIVCGGSAGNPVFLGDF